MPGGVHAVLLCRCHNLRIIVCVLPGDPVPPLFDLLHRMQGSPQRSLLRRSMPCQCQPCHGAFCLHVCMEGASGSMCRHGGQCCCQTWLSICSRAASVVSKSCAVLRAGMAAARPPSIARFPNRVLLRSDGAATSLCAEKIVDASSRLSLGAVQLCSHLCVLSYRVRLNGSSTRPARFRSSFGTAIMRSTALNDGYITLRTSFSKHWLSRHVPGFLLRHHLSRYEGQIYAPFGGLGHV